MKKFVFTNEKYQELKEKEDERLKLNMKNVDKEIDMAAAALHALDEKFNSERSVFESACRHGVAAGELASYQGYFEFLQDRRKDATREMEALLDRKRTLTEALLRVNNELRVLEEMRQEQYQAYCKEVAAEEAKELDTHMAFTIIERAV
ncbi:MAG: hypothetical protein EOM66_01250 [Clostridia bacterium]|nr:hypothetical protein [Clostridia bacterium]